MAQSAAVRDYRALETGRRRRALVSFDGDDGRGVTSLAAGRIPAVPPLARESVNPRRRGAGFPSRERWPSRLSHPALLEAGRGVARRDGRLDGRAGAWAPARGRPARAFHGPRQRTCAHRPRTMGHVPALPPIGRVVPGVPGGISAADFTLAEGSPGWMAQSAVVRDHRRREAPRGDRDSGVGSLRWVVLAPGGISLALGVMNLY